MPLRYCEYRRCRKAASRDTGDCSVCDLHLCIEHAAAESHNCPPKTIGPDESFWEEQEQRVDFLLDRINRPALKAIASELRGLPCRIPLDDDAAMSEESRDKLTYCQRGGQNWHLDIEFEDGITWLARFRFECTRMPPEPTRTYILRSEVATLKFLEPLAIPTPKVHKYEFTTEGNPVGYPYILMDKLPGSVLDWNSATYPQRIQASAPSPNVAAKLPNDRTACASIAPDEQGGKWSTYLTCQPCSGEMTTIRQTMVPKIQGYAIPELFSSPTKALGPFQKYESAMHAILQQQMDAYVQGEYATLPIDNYLNLLLWAENVVKLTKAIDESPKFYLKHQEDKGDHILVDADFNITGIIDWEWATTEPAEVAFASPCMMWPVAEFYDGDNRLSKEESAFAEAFERMGRNDIGSIVRRGRVWQRFHLGDPFEIRSIEGLSKGLRECLANGEDEPKTYAEWRKQALKKWKHDRGLKSLLARNSDRNSWWATLRAWVLGLINAGKTRLSISWGT